MTPSLIGPEGRRPRFKISAYALESADASVVVMGYRGAERQRVAGGHCMTLSLVFIAYPARAAQRHACRSHRKPYSSEPPPSLLALLTSHHIVQGASEICQISVKCLWQVKRPHGT